MNSVVHNGRLVSQAGLCRALVGQRQKLPSVKGELSNYTITSVNRRGDRACEVQAYNERSKKTRLFHLVLVDGKLCERT